MKKLAECVINREMTDYQIISLFLFVFGETPKCNSFVTVMMQK